MIFSALRKAPLAVALMLGCAALPAQAGWFSSDDKPAQKADSKPAAPAAAQPAATQPNLPSTSLEDSIRQAQLLRLAGQYPEAVKHLSQLMLVASDDARVISEYGKTLASMGRASDAVNFLTRAQQLQPGDWTIYSAMGVAYDQIGDQKNARDAYEHALSLKPDEASILSNYALSRMLAKDPDMARKLAALAESAGGLGDAKIARNIAMIRELAPETPTPAPVTAAEQTAPLAHSQAAKAEAHDNRVVMQRVPVDQQAGPVAPAKPAPVNPVAINTANTATHAPRSLQPELAPEAPQVATVSPKPVTSQVLPAPVVKAAENKIKPVPEAVKPATAALTVAAPALRAAQPIKTVEPAKPMPVATAKLIPSQPTVATASVTLRLAPPLKGEADQPAQPPKVLPPVKAATKDAVPGLRVSNNAY